ncbi:3-hydroxyacyl-CoA dehydrogenase [Gordonia amarae]|uniref:3-hydroxyacyl-CoA dehydrogenase n=2 Tax=Gordonia amarae TaxID=36821 RepID=A0A857KM21_9ACTN|nr:3-hydroxyacyl-CoA dehydrogenase [Gordonia amarae]MCS3880087.1 3-hydroxybutyryl-CoA dehydrogenase [Gordonia amarae]QHN18461.1 3-hydroxyacyl-CoA dehydrogenase [Gordonia amarae]QHN22943.1 3-hydroxyacyl-CoA dehydrogenase [Gordonia amarae]QHN31845.1 3-hydroxyacyl-CoA dehydrogenase [Gordonia amarae]QHN40592.1 3-hydroxyacyl-CoA dehydrogenase [Gordonia amarae]
MSESTNLQKVTVLGTGVLGSQIVMQAAYAGKDVVAYDIKQEFLDKLTERWEWMRGYYVAEVPEYTPEKFDAAIARITTSTVLAEAVGAADVVIEAVPEDLELKKSVWAQVGAAAPDHTILLTNSSSLLPSDFADATGHPDRFLALHFANMVWRCNTGEVMATPKTDPAVFERTVGFAEEINLVPIRILKETPGYVLNGLLIPWLEAAALLYVNGVANPADIDRDWTISTGAPGGPFQVYDVVGFNVVVAINASKAERTPEGDKFSEMLVERGISQGKAGLGDGVGFYEYENGVPVRPNPDWEL